MSTPEPREEQDDTDTLPTSGCLRSCPCQPGLQVCAPSTCLLTVLTPVGVPHIWPCACWFQSVPALHTPQLPAALRHSKPLLHMKDHLSAGNRPFCCGPPEPGCPCLEITALPPAGRGLLGAEGLKHGLDEPQAPGTGPHSQGPLENADLSKGVWGGFVAPRIGSLVFGVVPICHLRGALCLKGLRSLI